MYTSEIEKLEKRWAENPKGRNFAPLADAYRKAGELDRAIELCQAGLERHPDYVSAHIVYGRCLIDRKNDAGAAEVFQKVLGLDPENVLGLKMLAEIAERGGRHDETVEWLSRLLNADPMNGDAAEALARARGRAAQAPNAKTVVPLSPPGAPRAAGAPAAAAATTVRAPARPGPNAPAAPGGAPARPGAPARSAAASPPPPVARLVPEAKTAPLPKPDFVVEHESEERENPELKAIGSPQDLETFDGTIDFNTAAHGSARADGLEVHEEIELKPQNLIVEGLAHTQYESIAPPPAPEAAEPEEDIGTIDLPLIMPDDVTPAHVAAPSPRAEWASPPPPPPPPAPPPAAVALSDDDGAADTTALSQAEPVLTETMAELYMRQGHQEDALRVYQALLAERPGDARLRARVQALSPGGKHAPAWTSGESLPTFLRRILAGQPRAQALEAPEPPPPPRPPPPAPAPPSPPASRGVDPVGQSPLDHAFGITAHHPEPRPDVMAPGEATRLAEDTISLDEVFGEESTHVMRRTEPTPPAPAASHAAAAAPAAPPPPAASERSGAAAPRTLPPVPQETGGFSFDQFFNSGAPSGAPGAAAGSAAPGGAPGAPPEGPRSHPAVEDEGDLDQFQAWLRGLKS